MSRYGCPSPLQSCTSSLRRLVSKGSPGKIAWLETIGLLRAFVREQLEETTVEDQGASKAGIALLLVDALTCTDVAQLSAADLQILLVGASLLASSQPPTESEESNLFGHLLAHNWEMTPAYNAAEFNDFLAKAALQPS